MPSLRDRLEDDFKILLNGDRMFAISRRRLVLEEEPRRRGVAYIYTEDFSQSVSNEELADMTGFTRRQCENGVIMAEVGIVAPSFVPIQAVRCEWESTGLAPKDHPTNPIEWWEWTCELCFDYGARVPCDHQFFIYDGTDEHLEWALSEALPILLLASFYLDRQMNACGATGWDWLRADIDGSERKEKV